MRFFRININNKALNCKFYKSNKFDFSEIKQDKKGQEEMPNSEYSNKNYKINIDKKENFRILQDYFYENNIDRSKVLPRKNEQEASLLDIPEYRELYKNFSLVIREDQLNELDNIQHDVTVSDKHYKYGLTSKNEIPFKELVVFNQEEAAPKTPTESLFEILELDKESSYESLVLKFRTQYQHGKFVNNFLC